MKYIFIILVFVAAANATKIIAVLEITPKSDDVEMSVSEFRHLTDELRTRARESLLEGDYTILTRDNIMRCAVEKRNVAYIVGGMLLAAGIGVHIWF